MAELINAERLRQLRAMVEYPTGNSFINSDPISFADVAALLARLDFAERRLAAVLAVVRSRHERAKRASETAAQLDDSETRISLRQAEAREGMAQSIRADVEEAANG